jgi:protein involved in polysaccharide export with SLBB domain
VQISVEEDPSLDGSYAVNEIGAVELGYVGPVILYNKSEGAAADKVSEVLKNRHFRNATVHVKIIRASYDRVKVEGAVQGPSTLRIGAGDSISLNDALLRAGGLRPTAKGAKVRILRGGLLSAVAPATGGEVYSLVSDEGVPSIPEVWLKNNDVVRVYSSGTETAAESGEKEVIVLGEVMRQGVYRFQAAQPCTMLHLLFQLGQIPPYADQKAVKIIRRGKGGAEQELRVDIRKILEKGDPDSDVVLQNGDRVVFPAKRISLF